MNSRELVKAAIAHEETERVPYCIGFTRGGADVLRGAIGGGSVEEYVDNDVIRIHPPWWGWDNLGEDWRGMETPTSRATCKGTGNFEAFYRQLQMLRDHSDKYILIMIYGSHFEKANNARKIENFLGDIGGDPVFAKKLLTRIIDRNMVMLESFLNRPEIDGVLLGSDWGTQLDMLMSPKSWEELIRPGEKREYELVHSYGKDVWVHSCGCVEKIIPSLIEDGLDVLNPIQPECMDIEKLKNDHGDKLTFWGGISTQQTLPYGTPDEVVAETRRVRELMSKNGGYILSPAQELQDDVPAENMIALIETAKEMR
jgi:hypothetical protein